MIHVIVYANRSERGYDFYERSEGFPAEYLAPIAQICDCTSGIQRYAAAFPAIRYAPLQERYLLSLILRRPGDTESLGRSHSISIHFLLEAADSDAFWAVPFDLSSQRLAQLMSRILAERQIPGPEELQEALLSAGERLPAMHFLPRSVLLQGAFDCREQPMTRQLFLATDTSSIQEVDQLLLLLPPALRKDISFHTDIAAAQESRGIALNFCTGKTLCDLVRSDFPGSQNTDKFWHNFSDIDLADAPDTQRLHRFQTLLDRSDIPMYHKLYLAIDSWDCFWNFLHAALAPAPLETAVATLPEQALTRLIQQDVFTRQELYRLSGATRSMLLRMAIRQVLHRPEILEKPVKPSLLTRIRHLFRQN